MVSNPDYWLCLVILQFVLVITALKTIPMGIKVHSTTEWNLLVFRIYLIHFCVLFLISIENINRCGNIPYTSFASASNTRRILKH